VNTPRDRSTSLQLINGLKIREVAQAYEDGPMKGIAEQAMVSTAAVVPEDADPSMVAEALVELAAKPRGEKPYRIFVDAVHDGCDVVAPLVDRIGNDFYRRFGLERLLKVATN
jgi:hypothetical protein